MAGMFLRGSVWWARLAVPNRLRVTAGRREFVQSTGTSEYSVAKIVAASLLAAWRRQLYEWEHGTLNNEKLLHLAESGPALLQSAFHSLKSAADITGLERHALLQQVAAGRLALYLQAETQLIGYVLPLEALEPVDPVLGRSGGVVIPLVSQMPPLAGEAKFVGDFLKAFDSRDLASVILAKDLSVVELQLFHAPQPAGWLFAPNESVHCVVDDLLLSSVELEVFRTKLVTRISPSRLEHAQAERGVAVSDRLKAEVVDLVTASTASATAVHSAGKWAMKTYSEAVAAYCSSPDGLPANIVSAAEIRQRGAGLMVFAEFMGDLRLKDIDADALCAFRDGPLKTIPVSINKLPKELRRETVRETIAALREDGREWPLLSEEMRRTRMNWLIALFGWLHKKQYITNNPALPLKGETGLTKAERLAAKQLEGDEDEEGREPFSAAQLDMIFSQLHFQTGNGRHVKKPSYWYSFEYWLPLLGLYAGLRIKEASQLHLSDVRAVDGVWCLDINMKTADKSVKNTQSVRLVPVHSALIELGFIDYCRALAAEGYKRVFPELTWSKADAKYAKESGRKMSAMLKKLGMPRDGTLVYHCLRHNLNNAMARVPASAIDGGDDVLKKYVRHRVMGHEVGSDANTRHYTTATSIEMQALVEGVIYSLPKVHAFDIEFGLQQIKVALGKKNGERQGQEDMGPLQASTS